MNQKQNSNRHYLAHKQQYALRVIEQRKRANDFIQRQKIKCARCPETFHRCLEFHHLRDKEFNIAHAGKCGMAISRIAKEIEKCILLCANCHRKETYKNEFLGAQLATAVSHN